MYEKYKGNAIKSGFSARKPINAEFQKLYDAKCEEYRKTCKNEDLIKECAITFIQIEQTKFYCLKTGKREREDKWKTKKNFLKYLEEQIFVTPLSEIFKKGILTKPQEDEEIHIGKATYIKSALSPEQLAKLKWEQTDREAKEAREKEFQRKLRNTPSMPDWWRKGEDDPGDIW